MQVIPIDKQRQLQEALNIRLPPCHAACAPGCMQVIPIDEQRQLQEAFNIRLEELCVIDMRFLEGCGRPTVAVLYEDAKHARHIKTYEVSVKDKVRLRLNPGPWTLDACA